MWPFKRIKYEEKYGGETVGRFSVKGCLIDVDVRKDEFWLTENNHIIVANKFYVDRTQKHWVDVFFAYGSEPKGKMRLPKEYIEDFEACLKEAQNYIKAAFEEGKS